jgi:ATP-dependent exoDNAse (exonuclease V) beta subunit
VEFSWAGEVARHVGSVVHRWLQRMADDALEGWTRERIETLQAAFRAGLAARGVDEASLDAGVSRVRASLEAAIVDERGRWLLGPQQGARTEYRLAMYAAGERRHLVVDRVFTDAAGRRWIVDYKTSSHEGSDRDAFLDRERERYRAQLEGYLAALGETPDAETRLGLYFPLLAGWRDWRSSS